MVRRGRSEAKVRAAIAAAFVSMSVIFATGACERLALGQSSEPEMRPDAPSSSSPAMRFKKPSGPESQKIDSALLQAQQRSLPAEAGAPTSAVKPDDFGRVLVDIDADVTEHLLSRIGELGGSVISSFPQYRQVRSALPLNRLQELASLPEVSFIRPAETPLVNPAPAGPPEKPR